MLLFNRDQVREPLFVVVPQFNPWRWKSRVKHTQRAIQHFVDAGAVVVLVEVAFGRREFVFRNSGLEQTPVRCPILAGEYRHMYIPLRTNDELWLKENAINIGAQAVAREHPDFQQLMWADSDIHFLRPNIIGQIIHALQHYAVLQPFSHARDLGPGYEMLDEDYPHANGLGFVEAWKRGYLATTLSPEIERELRKLAASNKDFAHLCKNFIQPMDGVEGCYGKLATGKRVFPGLCMAWRRQAWEDVGGLIDFAIWGGADWHMSHALIEKTEGMMRNDLHRNYRKLVDQWYQRCRTHIRMNVGVLEGSVTHHWHGRKEGRGYNTKHSLLSKFGFDPPRHLKRDAHGLWQLHDDRSTAYVQMRDMMRRIAHERNEDSIDI